MAASHSPPIGFDHPTVNPYPNATATDGRSEGCACHDCDYAVEIDADLPPKCPACGGALTRITS